MTELDHCDNLISVLNHVELLFSGLYYFRARAEKIFVNNRDKMSGRNQLATSNLDK